MGYWICRDCAGVYHIRFDMTNISEVGEYRLHLVGKLGVCPLCGEVRQLHKAEALKETESKEEAEHA
jgi:hypothetical protein